MYMENAFVVQECSELCIKSRGGRILYLNIIFLFEGNFKGHN